MPPEKYSDRNSYNSEHFIIPYGLKNSSTYIISLGSQNIIKPELLS